MIKRLLALVAMLQVLTLSIYAASYIAGIPVRQIKEKYDTEDMGGVARLLNDQGYKILYYNESYIITATPDNLTLDVTGYLPLSEYPNTRHLFLINKPAADCKPLPAQAGKILLDLGSSLLLESDLNDKELREHTEQVFTQLSMEPMRFPETAFHLPERGETRTDIASLISNVSADSVQSLIQSLQDLQTRYAYADNRLQVAQWIRQQFINYGITNAEIQPFTWEETEQYNVVATIPGTVYRDQYIIVGGHHDSINNTGNPYVFAPGADDNASGTVATLEMARVMMQSGYRPKASIRFVTFAAEEWGFWGSKYYTAYCQSNNLNIRLMINNDMIAHNINSRNWQVRLMPYDHSLEHSAYAARIIEDYTSLTARFGEIDSWSSDSNSFWQRGYNVLYFFESDVSPYYHSGNDTVANLDPVYCAEVIRASAACAATFADMPSPPANLQIRDTGSGNSLLVTWNNDGDPLAAHYNVYYGTRPCAWNPPLYATGSSCAINGLSDGQQYFVAVSLVNSFGYESYLTYNTGIPHSLPRIPQNISEQPVFQGISLSWDANVEMDIAGYQIYRSQQADEIGEPVSAGLITANTYLDSDVTGSLAYYYYRLRAVDNSGNASPFTQTLKSRPITLDQGILIVDDTENLSGNNPFQATDEFVDAFYDAITSDFTTTQLDLSSNAGDLQLADICVYSSLLWYGSGFAGTGYSYRSQNVLQQYLQAGGNILFSVDLPSRAFEQNVIYPQAFGATTFINGMIGIGSVDYESSARFRYALPSDELFPQLQVDPHKTTITLNGDIVGVEAIEPNESCIEIYRYGSDYNSSLHEGVMNNTCVGVLNPNHSGKLLTLSFPLFSMFESQARLLIDHVFANYFNENFGSEDNRSTVPESRIIISSSHPNPFQVKTSFRVDLKNSAQPLQVGIYNLRGQLVKQIFTGNSPKSVLLEWDGKDENNSTVSSGVYFIRASQDGRIIQKRIVRVK